MGGGGGGGGGAGGSSARVLPIGNGPYHVLTIQYYCRLICWSFRGRNAWVHVPLIMEPFGTFDIFRYRQTMFHILHTSI